MITPVSTRSSSFTMSSLVNSDENKIPDTHNTRSSSLQAEHSAQTCRSHRVVTSLPPRISTDKTNEFLYNAVNHAPQQVALQSAVLGVFFSFSLVTGIVVLVYGGYWQLPGYICALSIFHFLEYYITAKYNPTKVTIECMQFLFILIFMNRN